MRRIQIKMKKAVWLLSTGRLKDSFAKRGDEGGIAETRLQKATEIPIG